MASIATYSTNSYTQKFNKPITSSNLFKTGASKLIEDLQNQNWATSFYNFFNLNPSTFSSLSSFTIGNIVINGATTLYGNINIPGTFSGSSSVNIGSQITGSVILSSGSATVSGNNIYSNSVVLLSSLNTSSLNVGTLRIGSITPVSGSTAGNFTIKSSNNLDSSTVRFLIINQSI